MPTQQSLITYQADSSSACLDRLVERFGDYLEGLSAIDKLDLIGSLAFWQSADTEHQQTEQPSIRFGEYLGIHHGLQLATSRELDDALEILADCSDGDAMTLMVALPQQLRDGVFAE